MSADAFAALDAFTARHRNAGRLPAELAPAAADTLETWLLAQIAAGRSPSGSPWQLRRDGQQALQTAGASLKVRFVGSKVYAQLRGPVARHHLGRARGGVERQILPNDVPPELAAALRAAFVTAFEGG